MMTRTRNTPPLPQVTLRVGVTGHRPNRLERSDPSVLAQQIERVLTAIRQAAADAASNSGENTVTLRVLSSIAEGADRLVASAALDLGYTLQVTLPFPQYDYEADFDTALSKKEFRHLLKCANTVFQLAAPSGERAIGYRAAGQIVLNQCDVLVALWDGEPGRGIGGTPEMIERAESLGVPILRIDAVAPHAVTFNAQEEPLSALARHITSLLVPAHEAEKALREYRNERWPTGIALTSFSFVRLLRNGRWSLPEPSQLEIPSPEMEQPTLQPFFAWTDALATYYGGKSRSAALRIQLLALSSVLFGLLSIPFDEHPLLLRVLTSLELATNLWVVVEGFLLARRPWHGRWLLYRSLAEHLRSLDLLAPLARSLHTQQANVGEQEEGSTAFGRYYLNAIVRQLGLTAANVTPEFLEERRDRLTAVISSQAALQEKSAKRYRRLEEGLHRYGLAFFAAAVLLSFYDVAHAFGLTRFNSLWTATCTAFLPALGAAFAAIATQGEYKRQANRAHSMGRTLRQMLATIPSANPVTLEQLAALLSDAAKVLTAEVRDWRSLITTRKPSLPV